MNSKLRDIVEEAALDYSLSSRTDSKEVVISEAEKAIRQAVGEEMLELKPGVVLAEPLASDKEWAEYEGYNKALDDWGQKIKQWQGGES